MTSKQLVLNVLFQQGVNDALDLRARAADMDGTALIAEEDKIPMFDPAKDYTGWAVGSPVCDIVEGDKQVFTLLIPHNASHYPDVRPNNNRTLWSLAHTKDPAKAKRFVPTSGISGVYIIDEVCIDCVEGVEGVYRSVVDNNSYAPHEYLPNWEKVE